MRWGAHDEFSFSFICFPQFIGSVKFFAIKHQMKVSQTFAYSNLPTVICTITVQHSLRSTSLSDDFATLQAGPLLKIPYGVFSLRSVLLRLRFYPFAYTRQLGANVGLPQPVRRLFNNSV
jgi:hypothetical protein